MLSETIPSYTPVLNGRAERTNGVITLKALSLLTDISLSDVLRELLEPYVIQHAVLKYNAIPTAKGFISPDVLRGRPGYSFKNTPVFGMYVLINQPHERVKLDKERKLQEHLIHGVYIGSNTDNGNIHSIWVNYDTPGRKMNVIKAENVHCAGTRKYISSADEYMAQI